MTSRFVRPGIRSILGANDGTQKEWMTSAEVSVTRTGRPAGMWSSLAVTASVPG